MKILALLSLGFAVALGMPALPPGVPQSPVLPKEEQSPLLGDSVPLKSHVEVENPAPQARLSSTEQQEKLAPVDMKQSQSPPEVKVEPKADLEVKLEPKAELEVKVEPKAELDVKVEPKAELKVKVEPKAELEVKLEPKAELEVKLEPKAELDVKAEPKAELDVKVEPKAELEVKVEPKAELDVKVEPKAELEVKVEPKAELDVKVEPKAELEVKAEDTGIEVKVKSEDKVEEKSEAGQVQVVQEVQPELEANPDLSMESDDEAQLQEQMNLDGQTNPLPSVQEKHIDMEEKYEMQDDEFEPLDDDMFGDEVSNTELSGVEESMRAAFLNPNPAAEPQPGKEDQVYSDMEEAGGEFMGEEDRPMFDEQIEGAGRRFLPIPERQGQGYCPGVLFEGRCYEFFKEPKRFADAEFFCQEHFRGGHLASITSPHIHRSVMDLMKRQIGTHTRTWVGGLRFLDTGSFVWLDGSFWDYADWLNGEPNNTANVEECLELLHFGNGKFNDFTCWEPQAFICSYPYELI